MTSLIKCTNSIYQNKYQNRFANVLSCLKSSYLLITSLINTIHTLIIYGLVILLLIG